jgi:hypothetical protein
VTVTVTAAGPPRVAEVRTFVGKRRRRPWYDWYSMAFAVVLTVILLGDLLAQPFGRLTGSGGAAPAQAVAGAALVAGAAAGLLMLAQALGPLVLSPADAAWLVLTPLDRREVLRRPAVVAAAIGVIAGAVLGVLALAMAGPFLRGPAGAGSHRVPWAWLVLAAVGGAGFFTAAMLAGVLAQPWPRWRARLRFAGAVVGVAATAGAVAGERWDVVSRAVTDGFAGLDGGTFGLIAVVGVAAAGVAALLVWRALPRFPARVVRAGSARAGTVLLAATFLNVPLLTWIAEDSHWRGRRLGSRAWPRLGGFASQLAGLVPRTGVSARPGAVARAGAVARPGSGVVVGPALVLAWADWRRLGRRPALLVAVAVSTLAPALGGAAFTGHAHTWVVAAVLVAGAMAAGTQGTAALRRDANDPALRRLLGVDARAGLTARAVLPVLLSAAWLTLALGLLALTGELPGALWPVLGLAAGPGVAAAALRIARTAPLNPAEQGPETAAGAAPPWLVTRAGSALLGSVGAYPALRAVFSGEVHGGTVVAQVAVSAIVLGGYLMVAVRSA